MFMCALFVNRIVFSRILYHNHMPYEQAKSRSRRTATIFRTGAGNCGILVAMEETRPILYGVADYALMRKKNGRFIDRTAKMRVTTRLCITKGSNP